MTVLVEASTVFQTIRTLDEVMSVTTRSVICGGILSFPCG